MNYYASPTGLSSNSGTIGSPWDLATALANASQTAGDILYLRDGTYLGKFQSTLNGGTVQSYPGEWAKIFGYTPTTLVGAINATQETGITVADASNIKLAGIGGGVSIDGEAIFVTSIVGNTLEGFRGAAGSYTPASAHSNGATVIPLGGQLLINGDNTIYRDFEVMSGNPNRLFHDQPRDAMGIGIFNIGDSNKFINLIVHDNHNGIFSGTSSSNTEYYGCLVYNNGRTNGTTEESEGSGIYLHNGAGYSRVYEMLILNGFGAGAGLFGQTGAYVGGDTQGSVFANNGANVGGTVRNVNLLVGTNLQQSPTYNLQDSHLFHPHTSNGTLTQMGWGSGIDTATILNNYFVGGGVGLGLTNLTQGTITGNKFYSTSSAASYAVLPNPDAPYTWNYNTYYDADPGRWVFNIAGVGLTDYDEWQVETGFDADGTRTTAAMPDTVVVRPNIYEIGRAHIFVYAPSDPSSINVNLATTGLTDNQAYTIKNAFDFFGDDVATGTYDAGSTTISLSLTGAALDVATAVGSSFTPATTLPDFGAFVVIPGAADASAPGTPTGLTANIGQSSGATGTMQLAWTLGAGTETSVTVRRIVDGVTTDIPLAADITSYTDTGQTVGLSYTYAVKASNASGDSAWSDTAQEVLTGLTCFGAPPSIG